MRVASMSDLPQMTEHSRARFDPTINLGHLITMGSILITMVAGYTSLNARVGVVEAQITAMTTLMERSIRADEQLQSLKSEIERQGMRIDRLEQR